MAEFRLTEDATGLEVAFGSGSDERAVFLEGMHYYTLYSQDGPHTLELKSNPVCEVEANGKEER